ncbi:27412_t:CDS:1, partial [Gigaspora margarita]
EFICQWVLQNPDIGYDFAKNEAQVYLYYTTGAACSEVETDRLTGDHTILRRDLCMDIGRSLNYAIYGRQIEGKVYH